jgi:hypothetical protein
LSAEDGINTNPNEIGHHTAHCVAEWVQSFDRNSQALTISGSKVHKITIYAVGVLAVLQEV